MTPDDYISYFRARGVTTVVRLNKKVYERQRFLDGGIKHHELYFPDGSCPSESILMRFLELAEAEPGAMAVHCKVGCTHTSQVQFVNSSRIFACYNYGAMLVQCKVG